MNKDYARHVHRTWVDTHSQSIRTDPEIYLPGEVDAKDEDDDSGDDEDEDDEEDEDELAEALSGMKRKATARTRAAFPTKAVKTMERTIPSSTVLSVIDDRRPDLTLIDVPVDESKCSVAPIWTPWLPLYGGESRCKQEAKPSKSREPFLSWSLFFLKRASS